MPVDPLTSPDATLSENRRLIMGWLREEDPARLEPLWAAANAVRESCVGNDVHLRGLIEVSNCCIRQCAYCGLRSGNACLDRYRMSAGEVLDCAAKAAGLGFGTVVIQGGEDYGLSLEWIAKIIRIIKNETSLAVTLSLGERRVEELRAWREAGADRYFMRFETSDASLYRRIHPSSPCQKADRIELLNTLRHLGYQIGSGIMVGLPGQTYESVVDDILLFRSLDLDMVGIGPWLPNPRTPMGNGNWEPGIDPELQVPNSALMTCKIVALARLYCPECHIPSTTALATIDTESGYESGLSRGANVVMPNLTPLQYRAKYEIYPKEQLLSDSNSGTEQILSRIESIGRNIASGPGTRARNPAWCVPPGLPSLFTGERHEQYQGTH